MITKTCPICGRTFTTASARQKYCSDACRIKGAQQARQEWKRRTGYNEKQRETMRRYRAEKAEEQARRQAAEDARRKAEAQARSKAAAEAYRKRLQDEASAGDPQAIMLLKNKLQPEYWTAFKNYELQQAELTGRPSGRTVNGISIYDVNFAAEVLRTIEERGVIISVSN